MSGAEDELENTLLNDAMLEMDDEEAPEDREDGTLATTETTDDADDGRMEDSDDADERIDEEVIADETVTVETADDVETRTILDDEELEAALATDVTDVTDDTDATDCNDDEDESIDDADDDDTHEMNTHLHVTTEHTRPHAEADDVESVTTSHSSPTACVTMPSPHRTFVHFDVQFGPVPFRVASSHSSPGFATPFPHNADEVCPCR